MKIDNNTHNKLAKMKDAAREPKTNEQLSKYELHITRQYSALDVIKGLSPFDAMVAVVNAIPGIDLLRAEARYAGNGTTEDNYDIWITSHLSMEELLGLFHCYDIKIDTGSQRSDNMYSFIEADYDDDEVEYEEFRIVNLGR